jgi:hypothetical protein
MVIIVLCLIWYFVGVGQANVGEGPSVACPEIAVILACLGEAQNAIRSAAYFICIGVTLAIVLPETDGADFKSISLA